MPLGEGTVVPSFVNLGLWERYSVPQTELAALELLVVVPLGLLPPGCLQWNCLSKHKERQLRQHSPIGRRQST